MNIGNLKIFRNGIQELVDGGIINAVSFDMSYYRSRNNKSSFSGIENAPYISKTDCGTCGCLLGWGPLIEGLEPLDEHFMLRHFSYGDKDGEKELDYSKYSEHFFELERNMDALWEETPIGVAWDFLFHPIWKHSEPTVEDALARLDILIEGNINVSSGLTNGDILCNQEEEV